MGVIFVLYILGVASPRRVNHVYIGKSADRSSARVMIQWK